jgi:hypothetical protein
MLFHSEQNKRETIQNSKTTKKILSNATTTLRWLFGILPEPKATFFMPLLKLSSQLSAVSYQLLERSLLMILRFFADSSKLTADGSNVLRNHIKSLF